jgi:flagellar hook-associated protein 3 FlgL
MGLHIRSTQQSVGVRVMTGLQNNLSRLGKLQEQLSSGKMIALPSDSPTGTVSAMQMRSEMRVVQQYTRNAEDGLGWLGTLDTTLTSSLDQVRRVRDLALQGMTTGVAGTPQAREAIAVEVDNIRESLVALANTRYLDRPLFGGTTTSPNAYDETGAYLGDGGTVSRTVGDGTKIRVDARGPEVFGEGPNQLFSVLSAIANDLRADPDSLTGGLARLDTAMAKLQASLADAGARYNRVEQMRQKADDRILSLRTELSGVEDVDLPNTIMEVQMQETAYQAALAATARVIQPSLIDFLR